jgi:hypothetical protein
MCIAGMVLMGIIPAVRAIKMMKGGAAKNTDILVGIGGMILGGGMIAKGLTGLAANSNDVISILITFFGVSTVGTGLMTYRAFSNPTRLHRLDWLLLHVRLMMGGFVASTTAFVVNVKFFQQFPDVVIWLAPTFLIVPLQIYFTSRIRKQRDAILAKK